MTAGASDTGPEVAAAHLALLRAATPERRLALALSLSRAVMALTRDAIVSQSPGIEDVEVGLHFVARCYGEALADEVRSALAARRT